MPEEGLLFTVVVHAATAISTLVVFRKDVMDILRELFQLRWNDETRFLAKILLSMVPAAVIGVLFEAHIERLFGGHVVLVGCMLLVTGALLLLADRAKNTGKAVGYGNAFVIGISQAVAILPGVSRSGATISTSVLLGIDRARAARFSFLMVVPLILGKMAKDVMDGKVSTDGASLLPLVAGFVAAFLAGLFACAWMVELVKRAKLRYFSIYCFMVGIAAIAGALIFYGKR